jgi:signal transduction histidine kinase
LDTLDPILPLFEQDRRSQIDEINVEANRTVKLVRATITGIVAGTIFALLIGSLVLTRRGLVPLDRLTTAVSRVSEKDFLLPVKVEELSTELAPVHTRLTATLDALKAAFDREKQAVADISHELRTPIAALGVTLDVALKKPRTPEQYKQTLTECRDINTQLGKLVERIMTLATLDAGTARTATEPVDAADLAAACATVIKPLAEAHQVTLTTSLARPLPVTTDPDKLREVLMNLLHNAVEYNRPGGVIELSAVGENGHGISFTVRDTGIGMAPDVRAKIFERFYRADPSRTATGVHAGLGLAIVKEYVARLGGRIDVDSTPNVGSTFRVTLPGRPA